MKGLKFFFFILFLSLFSNLTILHASDDIDGSGFIDSHHGISYYNQNQRLNSKTRLRYQGWIPQNNKTSGTFAFNATYDDLNFDKKTIELRELFIDRHINKFDLRIGRQFIIWGKMDGLSITDLVCPRDYSEFLSGEYDDTRLPVDAIKATYNNIGTVWQFLLIPKYRKTKFAPQGNPWAFKKPFLDLNKVKLHKFEKPANKFENSEFALKYSRFGNGLDYSLSLFHTWDDNPIYIQKINGSNIDLFQKPYRITVAGAEIAKSEEEFVYRLESALHIGKRHMTETSSYKDFFEKKDFNIGAGIDWLPGNNLEITGQFVYKKILGYERKILEKEENCLATLRITKKLFREILKLSAMNYADITNNSGFSRLSSDYAVNDDFHILLGSDWFYGTKGTFGQFNKNDNLWLEVKYSF